MGRLGQIAAWGLTACFALATFLPVLDTPHWWIRGLDFPRIHFLLIALPLMALVWWLLSGWGRWLALAVLGASAAYQVEQIFPYTPLAAKELHAVPADTEGGTITAMAINVLMENQDHTAVIDAIRKRDPDIFLLMETDERWVHNLEPLLDQYETVIRHPKDNYYGLVFATNLPAREARIAYLTVSDTPSVFAELETPSGVPFRFVGLHPRPPTVGVDTDTRDDQLFYAARFARETDLPVVVMGDFNVAAWSHTAEEFKRIGQYLDVRVGRGPIPSFDANSRLMRFPIDHLYVTPDVALVDFSRGETVGSDHFPMIVQLRFDSALAAAHNRQIAPLSQDLLNEIDMRHARHQERLDNVDREAASP